jgi:hypothetical protein
MAETERSSRTSRKSRSISSLSLPDPTHRPISPDALCHPPSLPTQMDAAAALCLRNLASAPPLQPRRLPAATTSSPAGAALSGRRQCRRTSRMPRARPSPPPFRARARVPFTVGSLNHPDPNPHSPHSENKNHFFLVQAAGGARRDAMLMIAAVGGVQW